MSRPTAHPDLDAMAAMLALTPREQLAALRYLNDRVASDLRQGKAAANAVGVFIRAKRPSPS